MKAKRFFPEGLGFGFMAILTVVALILGLRHLGKWQYWELLAFDQMLKWRNDRPLDERLLIVAITEEDIRKEQKWPLSDRSLAKVLEKLQEYEPQQIGLDIYRDIPVEPGHEELLEQLKKPNLIAVRNINTLTGTPAPASIPAERIGFNDIALDNDGVVRRNVLFAETEQGEVLYSFTLLMAFNYLESIGLSPQASNINPDYLQLGKESFIPLTPDSGGYQTIDSGGYQILFDYRRRGNIAKTVTFGDVLSGKIHPQWVKNKIVLIGTTAISLRDTFFTPYQQTGQSMPGVMVHGQLLSQFLDAATGERPLFWFWTEKQEKIWLVVWIIVGGLTGFLFRHPLAVFLSIISGIIIIFATGMIIFLNYGWIPIATPIFGFIVTLGTIVTYRSYNDHQKQETVMKLLGQNTSPEIANALWEQRDTLLTSGKLPGVSLTATLLFLDIKGFSTVSETMTPENLLNWLNQSLEQIAAEIVKNKGVVNKFTGDGVMAVFGVPIPRQHFSEIAHDAQNAVNCALAIGKYLDKLNAKCQQENLPKMQMRIGIYTGEVVAGSLGGKDRIEYGVIGDTVNTASRLESCDKDNQPCDCRILIGKETLDYLEGKFSVEPWGEKALKGKKQMVSVYRILN